MVFEYKHGPPGTQRVGGSLCAPDSVTAVFNDLMAGKIDPLMNWDCRIDGNTLWGEAPFTSIAARYLAGVAASPAPASPRDLDYIETLGDGPNTTPPDTGTDPVFSDAFVAASDLLIYGDGDNFPLFADSGPALSSRETNFRKGGLKNAICGPSACNGCVDLAGISVEFEQPFNYPVAQVSRQQNARELRPDVDLALNQIERDLAKNIAVYLQASTAGTSWSNDDQSRAPRYRIATLEELLVAAGGAKFLGRDAGHALLRDVMTLCRPARICRPCPGSDTLSFRLLFVQLQKATLINPGLTPPYPTLIDQFRQSMRVTLWMRETGADTAPGSCNALNQQPTGTGP